MVFKNLNLYKVFFLGVFLLTPWLLSAQQLFQKQLVFEHYTKNQGLSSNQVQEFCQDSEGFIWVATTVGLNKFDGYGFETFEHRTNDSLSLASNWVNSLKESLDRKSLWIATDNGLDKFDKKTEIFEKTNVRSEVFDFFFDKENNLWVASTQGLYKKDYLGKEFKKIADGRFHEIFIDSRDNIWVNKEFSFGTFDLENGLVDTFLRQVDVRTVIEDSQGKIWAGTKELGLVRIENNHTREIKEYSQQNGYFATSSISDIIEESKGKFIVAVRDGGLYYLDTEKDTATGFFMDKFNPKGLNSNALVSMFNDKWGNLWLGTYDKGINFLDMNRKPFLHYNMNFKEDGLPSNSVRSIHQDKTGEIWIGTKEGGCLSRFDYEKGTFQHYCHDENDPESVSGEFILCIENAIDPDYIWVGTYSSGLNYFNKKTGKSKYYRHLPGDKGSLNQDRVYVLYLDSKKQLWIGPREGPLQMLKNPEDDFISYVPKSKANLKAPHNEIRAFFEDSQHAYWIGTNYGLSNFNPENNERKIYIQDEEVEHSISHSMITAIFEDSGNNFWVGTQNGLNLMDRESGKFFSFNTEQGLPSSFIIGILEDGKGNLWLSTSNGISKFTPPKNLEIDHLSNTSDWGTFRNYNVNDGLQDNEFSPNAYHKLQNGEMIFGGINGFNIFHPDSIVDNKVVPEVHFTALKIYNEEVEIFGENSPLDRHINWMDKLVLDHNQNGFTIHFTALNFTSPEKVEYAYMLEGLDEKWNEVRNQRFAHYSHIAPGEYIFRVKASNNDGLWNEEGKSLKVIIRPPWYETFWFKFSLILVFSGILFLLVRMRINRLKNETIKLEKMVETRTKELQNKSVELQLLTKKLQAQNEELNSHQEELSTQYEKLEESHAKLKNTQLQLVQAEKMASLGVLTAGIAHEINNPINYIKSGVIGLKRALHDILSILRLYGNLDTKNNFNEKFKEIEDLKTELVLDTKVELSERVLENISNGAIKAAEIIKGLKTFSRMDDGNFVIYDIHDGLESTLLLLHHQFTEDIILQKNYGQIPMVACSPSKINQVFMNLLSNAIQALKGRGTITITTQAYKANHEQENWINNLPAIDETNQYISIIIEDTGFGIDKRTISHIFEPFFTTKDVGEGTGLGLSISLNIIDTHKGKIKVESRAGEGAKFTVILPVEQKN